MIKHLILYFFLAIVTTVSFAQNYGKQNFELKGPVASVIELEYDSEHQFNIGQNTTVDSIFFMKDGQLIFNRRYRSNGELLVNEEVAYNENEKIMKYSKFYIGLPSVEEIYQYNDTNNEVIQNKYRNGALHNFRVSEYDSLDNLIHYQSFKSDSTPSSESFYHYNNGVLIKSSTTNLSNKKEIIRSFFYNENGKIIKSIDSVKNTNSIKTYQYDHHGNETLYSRLDSKGNKRESRKEYNYHSEYYEMIHFDRDGKKEAYYKYDLNGNILIRTFYDDQERVRNNSTYEVDKYGNWTKETFVSDSHFGISIRTFDYYED